MRCLKPYHQVVRKRGKVVLDAYRSCGKCMPCRVQRREDWVLRMLHELEFWNDSCFITLTYSDEHLPPNKSLSVEDLSDFFKRLRSNVEYHLGKDHKIKYFACGEYGPKTHRPHYHAIIFGLQWDNPEHAKLIKDSWRKCAPWMWLPRWKRGRLRRAIAPVCMQSIRYVAGYVLKKAVDNSIDTYLEYLDRHLSIRLQKVFQTQSNGIGRRYAEKHADMIRSRCSCYNKPVPRYYRKLLRIKTFNNPAFAHIVEKQEREFREFVRVDNIQRSLQPTRDDILAFSIPNNRPHIPVSYISDVAVTESDDNYIVVPDLEAPVWITNIDYDERRLHTYSRRC